MFIRTNMELRAARPTQTDAEMKQRNAYSLTGAKMPSFHDMDPTRLAAGMKERMSPLES
jgi:ABC-type nitrate/sulfonate/bicarbonate transport system ATPase subunit